MKTTRREFLKVAAFAVVAPVTAAKTAVGVVAEPVVAPLLVAETAAAPVAVTTSCSVPGSAINLRHLIADKILEGIYSDYKSEYVNHSTKGDSI